MRTALCNQIIHRAPGHAQHLSDRSFVPVSGNDCRRNLAGGGDRRNFLFHLHNLSSLPPYPSQNANRHDEFNLSSCPAYCPKNQTDTTFTNHCICPSCPSNRDSPVSNPLPSNKKGTTKCFCNFIVLLGTFVLLGTSILLLMCLSSQTCASSTEIFNYFVPKERL